MGLILLAACVLPASTGPQSVIEKPEIQTDSPEFEPTFSSPNLEKNPRFGDGQDLYSEGGRIDFPINVGNSWIYRYHEFTSEKDAYWRISDSLVHVELMEAYPLAEVFRNTELLQGEDVEDFPGPDQGVYYWTMTDGQELYRWWNEPEIDHLAEAWLELRLPGSQCWFADPFIRERQNSTNDASMQNMIGCRRLVSDDVVIDTPDHVFDKCNRFEENKSNGVYSISFCSGIGVVQWGFINYDETSGYESILDGYSITVP